MAGATFQGVLHLSMVAETATGGVGTVLKGNAVATTVLGSAAVPFKCRVVRVQILVRGSSAHATAGVYTFGSLTPGGATTTIAIITKTASVSQQGKMLYERPTTNVALNAGQEVNVVSTTADGAANELFAWVVVESYGEALADNTAYVAA